MENKTAPTAQPGRASVNGIDMYYELYGAGQPLLLMHGGGSTINTTFGRLIPLLAAHYRLVAVELQGHGRTGQRAEQESFEQDADDAAALLRHLGVSSAHVLGFSNGGSSALQLAIRHPQLVNRLAVVSAAVRRSAFMEGFFEGVELATLDNMPAELKADFLAVNNDPAALQTLFEQDRNRMRLFRDWPDESLKSIRQPTLFASTDRDVVKPAHTLEMAALVPDSRVLILPGAHGACLGECTISQPDQTIIRLFAEVLTGFFADAR